MQTGFQKPSSGPDLNVFLFFLNVFDAPLKKRGKFMLCGIKMVVGVFTFQVFFLQQGQRLDGHREYVKNGPVFTKDF